jgi:hypothetical protein
MDGKMHIAELATEVRVGVVMGFLTKGQSEDIPIEGHQATRVAADQQDGGKKLNHTGAPGIGCLEVV